MEPESGATRLARHHPQSDLECRLIAGHLSSTSRIDPIGLCEWTVARWRRMILSRSVLPTVSHVLPVVRRMRGDQGYHREPSYVMQRTDCGGCCDEDGLRPRHDVPIDCAESRFHQAQYRRQHNSRPHPVKGNQHAYHHRQIFLPVAMDRGRRGNLVLRGRRRRLHGVDPDVDRQKGLLHEEQISGDRLFH